jgi:hypothetical protein
MDADKFKNDFIKAYYSRPIQILIGMSRILLLIIAILIFYRLYTEIEAVKILQYDPCRLCENKTGAVCFFYDYADQNGVKIIEKKVPIYPDINFSIDLMN